MINPQDLSSVAIITENGNITFKELFQRINAYAKLYKDKSYQIVGVYGENSIDWISAFYSGLQNNCIVVPIDYQSSHDDVAYILNDCKPELLFVSPKQKADIDIISKKIDYTPDVCYMGNITPDTDYQWKMQVEPDKTAVIIYTSGTTGNPKGVMLSFKNLISNISGVSKDVRIFTLERQTLMLLPLHHIFPLIGTMMAPFYVGGTIVMSPSMQSSDLLETLKNNKVAIIIGVPRLYELLYKGLKTKIDASFATRTIFKLAKLINSKSLSKKIFKKVHDGFGGNVLYLVSGGAALPKHVGSFFMTLGFDVLEGFGMTEASPMITFTRPGRVIIGSPGEALPGLSIEIRDGEVVAKGDNIMQGYYNQPEETAQVIKDGWLYTGDLGYLDKGYLFITGRRKEIIVLSSGKNINPVELESKLEKDFDVIKEVGVILHNNFLHAIIFPDYAKLAELGIENFEDYFRENVLSVFNKKQSSYKQIVQFTLINNELPKTRLSKIQRFKLKELIVQDNSKKENTDSPVTEEFLVLKKAIEGEIDIEVLPNHHIEFDLALDSLGKLSLIDFIDQRFGILIENEQLEQFSSIGELAEYIKNEKKFFKEKNEDTNWADIFKTQSDVKLPKAWITQNIIKVSFKYFFKIYFKFKGKGYSDIPDGPCIIAPNHQSFLDGLFVASFLKRKVLKDVFFYAKEKHVQNKILRFLADHNNVIIMDLNVELKESIHKLASVLHQGKKIILFPEGTRSTTGALGEFKRTFAILSTQLNIPVVPVAITGAYEALPQGASFPKINTRINVNFLKPIYPEGYTIDSFITTVREAIRKEMN